MQFKKLSVFTDGNLRRALMNRSQPLKKAFGWAICFPGAFLQLLSTGPHRCENLPVHMTPLYKLFDGSHAESDWIFNAFQSAQRIEATLTHFIEGDGSVCILVRIVFYPRGRKEETFSLEASLDHTGVAENVSFSLRR